MDAADGLNAGTPRTPGRQKRQAGTTTTGGPGGTQPGRNDVQEDEQVRSGSQQEADR